MNRKIVVKKLKELVKKFNDELLQEFQYERWIENKLIQRGNEVRVYKGEKFRRYR